MARAYILLGFTFMLVQLHISGNITKYINMRYSYLSISAAVLLGFLTIVQVIATFRKEAHDHDHDHCGGHCGHDHHHEEETGWKRWFTFILLAFPIFSILFLPIASLDSNIVKTKGFHFPVAEPGNTDPFMQRQFLKPDMSIYYGSDGYRQLMAKDKKEYIHRNSIALTDADFLKGMETIYNSPGEFVDKKLSFEGFVFKDDSSGKDEYFLFRFGIIHCVADSGVYGMLVEKPDNADWGNDEWVTVKGTIETQYYQPFRTTIPVLQVTSWKQVAKPKDEYVYRAAE